MARFKVSIQHIDYYESKIIDADNAVEAKEKYREMIDYGSVEPIDSDFINERAEIIKE